MKCFKLISIVLFFCCLGIANAQTATIAGVVLDENNYPLSNVNITTDTNGVSTDTDGYYLLQLISDTKTTITFSHIGHKNVVLENIILNTNETFEFNPIMKTDVIQIDGVVVTPEGKKSVKGITNISPQLVRHIPGANAGVENILKLLPGVSSNNELSTQYAVRGGNYDENLVYVNEIEVYRPFLIRSGQQEGLGFVNSNMVQNLAFSSGGFQAKYGDKLSSVLDITYKTPVSFGLQFNASLLGANATLETINKNKRFSSISGVRYRDNSLFVNSQQTKTNFNPTFVDFQSFLTYRFSNKFHLNFLGNIALNHYQNKPLTRQTNFGTFNEPRALLVFYEGQENNKFNTVLGALKGNYFLNDNTTLKLIASLYHTTEEEYSDIIAQYELGEINTDLGSEDLGEVTSSKGIGSQFNRARNDLDALIFNISHKGIHSKEKKTLEWGVKYTHEDIRDQLREFEFIDSAGFSIRPPNPDFINNEPEAPFEAPIIPFEGVQSQNFVKTSRFSGFVQYGIQTQWKDHDIYYNIGIRSQHWSISGVNVAKTSHTVFSPRAQFSIKPDWGKDMLFRFSAGMYHQPPFYRELRDVNGTVRPNVKAQRSVHYVLGNEYSLILWDRPFKLVSETYYKKLSNVNSYTLEDVRIRYAANNNSKAYAYGVEVRLNGAFVPGTESWVSLGYLKTEESINDRGYIARPTDQRIKFGVLFQDYIPSIPNLKMYLNMVYNTGLPGGSPSYTDPYIFQSKLRDYKRVDLGISHIFVNTNNTYPENHWLHGFKELSIGFEIFNMFNNQNSITNTWVRDVESKQQFAIPNFMTTRVLNLKLNMRF